MRKKKLLEHNRSLFHDLETIKAAADELRKENALLRKTITELENKNIFLKKLYSENKFIESSEQFESNESLIKKESTDCETKGKIKLPPMTDYAASVIGKIIISAAKKCNSLTAQNNPDTKDMINLILGRTEVSKAEILKIISTEEEPEVITELVNKELSLAEDYFASVMAQL